MGLFTSGREFGARAEYDTFIKNNLKPKDGLIHVVMIDSFSKWINQIFGCETKYTAQIDTIITAMQYDGYEIVDIKFNSIQDQGYFKKMEGFHTLIMYR